MNSGTSTSVAGIKEYATLGALLTGAIAWFPLASSWFYAVGLSYYETLMSRVGLSAAILDLPERQMVGKGYELVRGGTANWISLLVLSTPFFLLLGVVIGLAGMLIDRKRASLGYTPVAETGWGKFITATGRVAYFGCTFLSLLFRLWLAVWASPTLGIDAAQRRVTCVKTGVGESCPDLLDYGGPSDKARLLVADKTKAYVFQLGSLRIIKLDNISEITGAARRKRPNASVGDSEQLSGNKGGSTSSS